MRVLSLLDTVRSDVLRDSVSPFLFSQESLLLYANEGYQQLARRTHYFRDRTSLAVEAGKAVYDLPVNTIFIHQVWLGNWRLEHLTRQHQPAPVAGKPRAYSTDVPTNKLILYPTPDTADSLSIHRVYKPDELTLGGTIDMPSEWAVPLQDWIAYRALRNNDPDGSDTIAADKFWESWEVHVRDVKRAVMAEDAGAMASAQPVRWI